MENVEVNTLRVGFVFLLSLSTCLSLEITRLSIPSYVQNGSEESVLLDCEYSFSPKDDQKLVVKWFHENDPIAVYQWIPELDIKIYSEKFRINEDYEIPSGNKYTRSRAVNIQRPTTELSGTYSCQVESLEGRDVMEDEMIVYALPSHVNLNYTIADGMVEVFCEVENVFPLPDISLFQIEPGDANPMPIDDVELEFVLENGAYDLELSTNISEIDLRSEGLTFFGCSVILNGTEYEKVIKVPYFPDPIAEKQEGDDSDDSGSSGCAEFISLTTYLSSLLFLLT